MANPVRHAIATAIAQLMGDPERPKTAATNNAGDLGPIPVDSPVRQVHRDVSMFIGGVRALLLQTLHPDAMYAVAHHSDYEHDPLGRLQRTAHFLAATVFGTQAEAETAIDRVRTIHQRVTGDLADGRTYRADDPHLLAWVHCTEVDSFLAAFQRYSDRPLDQVEADRYVADMAIIGSALGARDLPQNQTDLAATLEHYRSECRSTPECRDATRFLFAPQLPSPSLACYPVIFGAANGLLPGWARRMLLLPAAPGIDPLIVRPAATVLTGILRWAVADYGSR